MTSVEEPERPPRPRIRTVLLRGLKRRCPRCGKGELFRRWIHAHERCAVCGLVYQRDYGDTWMYIIVLDRIPIFLGVAAVYFGYRSTNPILATIFLVLLAVPLIATMRERQGVAIALAYLSRLWFSDSSDDVHRF